jgi:hypothetical protein
MRSLAYQFSIMALFLLLPALAPLPAGSLRTRSSCISSKSKRATMILAFTGISRTTRASPQNPFISDAIHLTLSPTSNVCFFAHISHNGARTECHRCLLRNSRFNPAMKGSHSLVSARAKAFRPILFANHQANIHSLTMGTSSPGDVRAPGPVLFEEVLQCTSSNNSLHSSNDQHSAPKTDWMNQNAAWDLAA